MSKSSMLQLYHEDDSIFERRHLKAERSESKVTDFFHEPPNLNAGHIFAQFSFPNSGEESGIHVAQRLLVRRTSS